MPSSERILRFSSIAVGLVAGPGLLFLLPFLLTSTDYAVFAKVLAVSQLISIVGTVGLEVACPREGVSVKTAGTYVVTTTLAAALGVFVFANGLSTTEFSLALLAAMANTMSTVLQSYLIFAQRPVSYGSAGVLKAVVSLLTIVIFYHLELSAAGAWATGSLFALVACCALIFADRSHVRTIYKTEPPTLLSLVKVSLPLAIIYGAATLPFVLDRVVAQSALSASAFAQYAVAVTWALPLIYLGNIFQQFMISEGNLTLQHRLLRFGSVLFGLGGLYVLAIWTAVSAGLRVPYFATSQSFLEIWIPIALIYLLYTSIVFPAAALIQKDFSHGEIVRLARSTAVAVGCLTALLAFIIRWDFTALGPYLPIIVIAVFALTAALPRFIFVCTHLSARSTRFSPV